MTNPAKRFLRIGAAVLATALVIALGFILLGGQRFRAETQVLVRPYTNAVFARNFEAEVIKTIPGVISLRALPGFTLSPAPGAVAATNGAMIRIIATGPSLEAAQRAANEAATGVCRNVLTNYGVTGMVVQSASNARRYSFFRDYFKPAVARLLGR